MHTRRWIKRAAQALLFASLLGKTASIAQNNSASVWPQFRGPTGLGVSASEKTPISWTAEKNIRWKIRLPGAGGSSPIVWSNQVYLTSYTGYGVPGTSGGELSGLHRHLLCLQRADGKLLWQKDIPATQPEQARVRDHGYASSTPAADQERVYGFFGKSGVMAFSHKGDQLWHADVGSKTHEWGSASSPLLYRDLIIINAAVESESLIALNKKTGQEVWRTGGMKESWNTPILVRLASGKTELVVAIAGQVLGIDPNTGERLWNCATGIAWYMVPSLVNDNEVVYCIGGRTGGALAVRAGGRGDVTQSHRLWRLNKGSNVSSPILHQGHLYWLHENLGIVYCVEAATGKVVFEERLVQAGQFYASPVLAGGKLYGVTRNGRGFVIKAQPQFELLARNELADRSSFDASPALDGNRLLIRSDQFLYCIEEN